MTGQRTGYAIALGAAVLALVVSVGAAVALAASGGAWARTGWSQSSDDDGWGPDPGAGPMMGRGRGGEDMLGGGMMGDWNDPDTASISAAEATTAAEQWVATHQSGASVGEAIDMPMGYLFVLTEDGQRVGTIMVNDDTGQVMWWGAVPPAPTQGAS